ncbi:MAG TPA: glycosyltransferase 87 family protein [Anaerolineae bacterium]|nr:glycosyltransferase 87 family protein [Anaerolineae bacterium]HMR67244.1 glycosyltransferase 87 family protein [Anaerolineae bacterium]
MLKRWPANLITKPWLRQTLPVAALALVWGWVAISIVLPNTNLVTHGFIGRYTAARLLVRGEFGPQVYNDYWFIRQVQATANAPVIEIFTPNLPTLALLTLPFVGLDPWPARNVWLWLSYGSLLLATGLLVTILARQYGLASSLWAVTLGSLCLMPALEANFAVGQVYTLLLLCLVLAWWGWVTGNDALLGLGLGLAFLFKTSGLILWLLLVTHRRWPAFLWLIGPPGLVMLLSLPWLGLDTWLVYPKAAAAFSERGAVAVTAYQTTTGFFKHLFDFDPVWNPAPLAHLPGLAWLLTLTVSLLATAVTLWLTRLRGQLTINNEQLAINNEQLTMSDELKIQPSLFTLHPLFPSSNPPILQSSPLPSFHPSILPSFHSLSFAVLIPLAIVLLPVAEEYHFVLLLIPAALLGAELFRQAAKFELILFAAAFLLLMLPISFKSEAYRVGWWALLAYPRLYAGWLIWYLGIRRLAAGLEQKNDED